MAILHGRQIITEFPAVVLERFFEEALAIEAEPSLQPEPEPTGDFEVLLPRVARMLREQVLTAGPLAARDVPIAFSAIPEFRNSSWFGCFSLRALMSRLLALEPALKLEGDPNAAWTVVLRDGAEGTQPADRRISPGVRSRRSRGLLPVPLTRCRWQRRPSRWLSSWDPAYASSHWAGYGTFKALLAAHPQPDLLLVETRGGFLLDPARHDRGAADELPEELAAFARRVSTITGTPPLSPAEYAGLFAALAALLDR